MEDRKNGVVPSGGLRRVMSPAAVESEYCRKTWGAPELDRRLSVKFGSPFTHSTQTKDMGGTVGVEATKNDAETPKGMRSAEDAGNGRGVCMKQTILQLGNTISGLVDLHQLGEMALIIQISSQVS